MLKMLCEDLLEAIVFRVRPEVCVEPTQLVCCASANGFTENRLIRVKNRELFQKFFRFSQGVGLFEDNVASNRARYRRDKLNDGLMRQAHRVFDDAAPENFGCNLLLFGKPAVEPIDQDVGVNESGHAGRDPLCPILGCETARRGAPMPARGGVRGLDRTNGVAIPDSVMLPVSLEESRESLRRPVPSL